MDPIERAIRGALEKGNIEDEAFRQRIYGSAEQALIRSLAAKQNLGQQEQAARVMHLRSVAAMIEREFAPAVAPQVAPPSRPVAAPRPQPARVDPGFSPGSARAPAPQGENRIVPPPQSRQTRETANEVLPPNDPALQAERKQRSRMFNRLAGLFVFLTLLALIVMLGWAVWTSDLLNPQKQEQARLDAGGASAQDDDVANWITVFLPSDITSVQVGDGVTAELRGSGKDAYLELVSSGSGTASFEVGRGVLETLQGKKVVFDVRGRTNDGSNVEVAVGCEMAGMGQCQRTRFQLDGQTTDNLLIVQLADTGPEASGTLTLTPDLGKTGNPVHIMSIRVRIEP